MEKFISPSKVIIGQPHAAVFARGEFCDKAVNIQFQGLNEEQKKSITSKVKSLDCESAKPYVQGDSNDWLLVEFWSSNMVDVAHACVVLAEVVGLKEDVVPGLSHPEFQSVFSK